MTAMGSPMPDRLSGLLHLLEGAEVRSHVAVMIAELGSVDASDAESLVASIDARLVSMATSLREVCIDDDRTEAFALLPSICLELRFEWMRYNVQLQYLTIKRGLADPVLMARGAALLYIIEAVEMHLDAEGSFVVSRITADPVATARGAVERTDRLFALMNAASGGGRDAVDVLLQAQAQIARYTNSAPVRHVLSKAISAVMEKLGRALRISADDFMHALEGVLIRRLGNAPVRVVLGHASPDPSVSIPSAVANGLLKAATDWMDALRASSMTADSHARRAAGRPTHITIMASVRRENDLITLTMNDDADGTVDYRPDRRVWPMRDFKLQFEQAERVGSTISFGCFVTSVSEYLLLRVGSGSTDVGVAVPLQMVQHIEQRDAQALTVHGSRLIDRRGSGTVALIDLGDALFGTRIEEDMCMYVHVRAGGDGSPALALRVRAVDGIVRGSVKSVPILLAESPLRGFVQSDDDLVAVLDFDRLLARAEAQQRDSAQAA